MGAARISLMRCPKPSGMVPKRQARLALPLERAKSAVDGISNPRLEIESQRSSEPSSFTRMWLAFGSETARNTGKTTGSRALTAQKGKIFAVDGIEPAPRDRDY